MMNNLYAEWCAANNKPRLDYYAFKCTAESGGSDYIAHLRGGSRHHLFLAVVLQSNGLVKDVERLLMYQSRVNEAFQVSRFETGLLEVRNVGEEPGLPPGKRGKRKSKK